MNFLNQKAQNKFLNGRFIFYSLLYSTLVENVKPLYFLCSAELHDVSPKHENKVHCTFKQQVASEKMSKDRMKKGHYKLQVTRNSGLDFPCFLR